ncbi:MAG: hypothetical protein JO041_00355 [Acidobacteria bacterium]|nr:hypothetical protein [Acidobacteriota bacterium]
MTRYFVSPTEIASLQNGARSTPVEADLLAAALEQSAAVVVLRARNSSERLLASVRRTVPLNYEAGGFLGLQDIEVHAEPAGTPAKTIWRRWFRT